MASMLCAYEGRNRPRASTRPFDACSSSDTAFVISSAPSVRCRPAYSWARTGRLWPGTACSGATRCRSWSTRCAEPVTTASNVSAAPVGTRILTQKSATRDSPTARTWRAPLDMGGMVPYAFLRGCWGDPCQMGAISDQIIEGLQDQLTAYMERKGLRSTSQRRLVSEVFFRTGGHLSIDEMLALARKQDQKVGYATVYRTMKL